MQRKLRVTNLNCMPSGTPPQFYCSPTYFTVSIRQVPVLLINRPAAIRQITNNKKTK